MQALSHPAHPTQDLLFRAHGDRIPRLTLLILQQRTATTKALPLPMQSRTVVRLPPPIWALTALQACSAQETRAPERRHIHIDFIALHRQFRNQIDRPTPSSPLRPHWALLHHLSTTVPLLSAPPLFLPMSLQPILSRLIAPLHLRLPWHPTTGAQPRLSILSSRPSSSQGKAALPP